MEFYMVTHYTYDGYAGYDQSDVVPYPTSQEAMDYLLRHKDTQFDDYHWETDGDGFKILIRRTGQYGYDYYFLQKMEMGKEME